ncbi:zinc-dependent alcohol dehydrogenase family protein [Labilithrix luteola]|uniref:zinc-dependent alcohol dehydrogenase family protein n=1 Tax=Labilithrix luteola TaxID=1391654 RepID=UPI000AA60602|nr:NAD(P)-dependent alcohol dehydrogenase [Labilithrix luteola]
MRIRATSVNYRDLMVVRGTYAGTLKKDLVALSDGAGEVASVGPGVTRWKVGDRVCLAYFPTWQTGPFETKTHAEALGQSSVDGVLAEYVAIAETGVVRMPEHLSFEEAATLPCAGVTAWHAVAESTNRLVGGQSLLVLGTGGVSIFAAQLGLAAGLRVIATTSSESKAARLRELGVSDVVNYRATPEWQREVLRLTGGEGVDQIIETGGAGTLARSIEAVKASGRISLIGLLTGKDGRIDPLPILLRNIHLEGTIVGSVAMFERMNRALEVRRIKPVIDEVFDFDRASSALAKLESGSHFGKIVIRI